jgi:hypothetical protein
MPKCPSCNSSYRKRLARGLVLRLIPNSKFYSCHNCKTRFLKVPYFFKAIVLKKFKENDDKAAAS